MSTDREREPTKKPRKERKSKRPEIINAAMKLFSHYGLDGVSHAMIAEEAGIVRSAIPKYFGNTDNLAVICITQFIDKFLVRVAEGTENCESYEEQVEWTSRLMKEHREEWQFVLSVMLTPSHQNITREIWSGGFTKNVSILMPYYDEYDEGVFPDVAYTIFALHVSYIIGGNEAQYDRARKALVQKLFPGKK